MTSAPFLAAAAAFAGAMNAAAGGGSFVTLPALLVAGVPPVAANATSTVALCPASFASAWAFREEFRPLLGVPMPVLLVTGVLGAVAGAALLLNTSERRFEALLPWLMLAGTVAFAAGPRVAAAFGGGERLGAGSRRAALLATQLVLGVYAGYFGGAVGILTLAAWSVFGARDVHAMNAAKALVTGAANAIAVVYFALAGVVWWRPAVVMLVAAVAGGYVGARVARRVPRDRLRAGIVLVAGAITAAMFAHHG